LKFIASPKSASKICSSKIQTLPKNEQLVSDENRGAVNPKSCSDLINFRLFKGGGFKSQNISLTTTTDLKKCQPSNPTVNAWGTKLTDRANDGLTNLSPSHKRGILFVFKLNQVLNSLSEKSISIRK